MQSRTTRRRLLALAGAWLGVSLSLLTAAQVARVRSPRQAMSPAETDGLQGPLPSMDSMSRIRALARSSRPEAALELAELSLSAEVTSRARTLILAIRALARFTTSEAAQRALLRHLRNPSAGDDPALRNLARATAAHALAAGNDTLSVRALVLLASGPNGETPELRTLARSALAAYPPDERGLEKALPWLDQRARTSRMAWIQEEKAARERQRVLRCQDAKQLLFGQKSMQGAPLAELVSELTGCPKNQQPAPKDFARLAKSNLTWALRGMAALGLGHGDASWRTRAETALRASDPTVRSAAAWFLSSTSQAVAKQLAEHARPEIQSAAKNQLEANEAGRLLEGPRSCPADLAAQSTRSLFERFAASTTTGDGVLLGCLASRLRSGPGPGLTAGEVETLALEAPAVARLLVARGLGESVPSARTLARGLAERLYASESDDYVRRFLCLSLRDLGESSLGPLGQDLRLDPDPICRSVGGNSSSSLPSSPALATHSSSKRYLAARVLAPPLSLEPAPDGFVGARVLQAPADAATDLGFVDCRETGEPAWACGQSAQKPR